MVEYNKVNAKVSDTQLKKLKAAAKNKTGKTLRMSLKMLDGNNLPHEWLFTTRQKTKLRNCFNNNMSTDLKKKQGSGTTTLIISNEEMNDIMKIVQALEDSNILLKGVTKTIKNETKEQKGGFLSMLLSTLGASLLGDLLAGKGIERAGSENIKGKGIVRAGTGKDWDF